MAPKEVVSIKKHKAGRIRDGNYDVFPSGKHTVGLGRKGNALHEQPGDLLTLAPGFLLSLDIT